MGRRGLIVALGCALWLSLAGGVDRAEAIGIGQARAVDPGPSIGEARAVSSGTLWIPSAQTGVLEYLAGSFPNFEVVQTPGTFGTNQLEVPLWGQVWRLTNIRTSISLLYSLTNVEEEKIPAGVGGRYEQPVIYSIRSNGLTVWQTEAILQMVRDPTGLGVVSFRGSASIYTDFTNPIDYRGGNLQFVISGPWPTLNPEAVIHPNFGFGYQIAPNKELQRSTTTITYEVE